MEIININLRRLIRKCISPLKTGIIINSYGRSGSTMLWDSILSRLPGKPGSNINNFCLGITRQLTWDLNSDNIRSGLLYKTHDYPPINSFKKDIRVVYLFSNPINVILSLLLLQDKYTSDWFKEHFSHLKAPYQNPEKMILEDIFCLENHLDKWLLEDRFPVAFVRYEKLWEYQDELSKFCEVNITLPPFKKRADKTVIDENIVENIKDTYRSLSFKVNKLDDFFCNNYISKCT